MAHETTSSRDYRPNLSDATKAEIKAVAAGQIVAIADHLLLAEYPHKKRSGAGFRYGRTTDGQTWLVTPSGRYDGWAKDWRGSNHDAIGLVEDRTGCGFYDALYWLADFCDVHIPDDRGLSDAERAEQERAWKAKEAEREARRKLEQEQQTRTTAAAHEAARKAAADVLAKLEPADGSHPYATRKGISLRSDVRIAAERITARLWDSKAERFQDNAQTVPSGALVIPMQDATGAVLNIQTIPDAPKAPKLFLSGGQVSGLFHIIPGTEPGYLVEGFATGCTVAEATGRAVFVAFSAGNLPKVAEVIGSRAFAVAADNDQSETGERDAKKTGLPYLIPPTIGHDWNDYAATHGLDSVTALLAPLTPPEPPKPRPHRDNARRNMTAILSAWFASDAVTDFAFDTEGKGIGDAPALLLPVGTGIGKTQAALKAGLAWKADRSDSGPIVVSVPMHSLAEDIGAKLKSIAPDATFKIWQGRGRDGMCQNREAVADYIAAHASPGEYCRTHCPFREECSYLAQSMGEAPTVWIITHALLTETPPKSLGKPCLVIADEKLWGNAVTGADGSGHLVDGLRVSADFDGEYTGFGQGQEVADRCTRLSDVLAKAANRYGRTPGPVTAADLAEYGFTPETINGAIEQTGEVFNWLIGKKPDRETVQKWGHDRAALGRALGYLREIKRAFDDGADTVWRLTAWKDREGRTMARRTGTRSLNNGWAAPMLFLDATANAPALRAIVPQIEVAPTIEADTPHARHHWRKTKGMGAARQRESTEAKAQDMARIAWMRWRLSGGGSGLIVCHKVTHEHMTEQGKGFLPPGWSVEHFKNTTGRDDWKGVRFVEIFGRVLPPIESVELKATALTCQPVKTEGEELRTVETSNHTIRGFQYTETTRTLPDGRAVSVGRYSHPDPMANAILQEDLDGELIQCAGRARAVNRTEANHVTITLHGDTYPEGLPMDGIEEDAPAHPIDKMLSAGRGKLPVLMAPTDAAAAYPELWGTPKAAERDFVKSKERNRHPNSYIYSIKGLGCLFENDAALKDFVTLFPDTLIAARYQKEGPKQKWKKAFVPAGMAEAFPAWIADALGCAVRVEWTDAPPPPPDPPRPDVRPVSASLNKFQESILNLSDALNAPPPPDQRAELLQVAYGIVSDDAPTEERKGRWAQMILSVVFDAMDREGIGRELRASLHNLPESGRSVIAAAMPWLSEQGQTGMNWMVKRYGGKAPADLLAMVAPSQSRLEAFL